MVQTDPLYTSHSITRNLVWATLISCLSTLQFGFHLAVFNAPSDIVSCEVSIPGPYPSYEDTWWGQWGRHQCIHMGPTSTSSVNTLFTVGGLLTSTIIGSQTINSSFGRIHLQSMSAFLFFAGSILVALANNALSLNIGRFMTGLAAGACMVVAPIFINEVTPFNHRGFLGSMLQFGVPIGILTAQLVALLWSNDQQWRNMFVFGALLGLLQLSLLYTTVESPKWLITHRNDVNGATEILHSLRSDKSAAHHEITHWRRSVCGQVAAQKSMTETSALLEQEVGSELAPLAPTVSRRGSIDPSTLSVTEYMTSRKYRKEWVAVSLIMTAQQLCGMNAITFYGVSVMSNVVPDGTNVLYLTSAFALTNTICAPVISPFIDRVGRKPLLLVSVATMGLFSVVISLGLINRRDVIATLGCFGFIVGYSLGLGQIPFLMVSEMSSPEAIAKAQSLGTMLNWTANIAIAFLFPQLRAIFHGYIFLVFFFLALFFFAAIVFFVPETKNKLEYRDIWEGYAWNE